MIRESTEPARGPFEGQPPTRSGGAWGPIQAGAGPPARRSPRFAQTGGLRLPPRGAATHTRWGSVGASSGRRRAAPRRPAAPSGGSDPHEVGERGGSGRRRAAPRRPAAPSGGSDPHEVGERGGSGRRRAAPRRPAAPSGGSDPHEVGERGGHFSAAGR